MNDIRRNLLPKVFVSVKEIPESALNIIKAKADLKVWMEEKLPTKDDIIREIKQVDGFYCQLIDKVDKEVINAGENLRVISQVAVGYDNIDVETATKRGIYVTNTPGVLTDTTADYAFALLMAVTRRIAEADRYVRRGDWKIPWSLTMFIGGDIWEKTIGVLGLGRIGSAVAKRAAGFNMKILYHDVIRNSDLEKELGIKYVDFETLLKQSDFVTLHIPLLPETYHLMGEKQLKLMKKTAFLINTSRGPVVDEKALYRALEEGWIRGAGIDVHEEEPTDPANPLLKLENITVSPHIASASVETRTKMAVIAAENLVSALEGEIPPNLVNKEVLKI